MSDTFQLTQWHEGSVKPVHEGVYQRAYNGGLPYYYWNGNFCEFGGKIYFQEVSRLSVPSP